MQSLVEDIGTDFFSREAPKSFSIDDLIQSAVGEGAVWSEVPVDIDTFVEDVNFCGHPPLTDVQRRAAYALLGEDPKEVFSRGHEVTTVVLLLGKGSGKDTWAALVQLYICYWLNCMKSVHRYLDVVPGDAIELVNVSKVEENAERVYFNRLRNRLTRCMWFMDNFDIADQGRRLTSRRNETYGRLNISGSKVVFPDLNINCYSENSSFEKYEGYNTLYWCMDEASAFYADREKKVANAPKVYSTLRSSATTRFGSRWKGCILSWPRHEDKIDFTVQMYNLSLSNPTMVGFKEVTWIAGPRGRYGGEVFRFEYAQPNGEKVVFEDVPVEFRDEATRDPLEFLRKYCCVSLRGEDAVFDELGVRNAFNVRTPLFDTAPMIVEHKSDGRALFRGIGTRIVGWNVPLSSRNVQHVIHVDLGRTGSRAALLLAHGEPLSVDAVQYSISGMPTGDAEQISVLRVVEDAHIVWEPRTDLPISIENVKDIVLEIASHVSVAVVSYDQWNSASALEAIAAAGIRAVEHTITNQDYIDLERLISVGAVSLLEVVEPGREIPLLEEELFGLRDLDGKVVKTESKDLADCLAGVARILNGSRDLSKIFTRANLVSRTTKGFAPAESPWFPADFGVPGVRGVAAGGAPAARFVTRGQSMQAPRSSPPIPKHHVR